MENTYGIGISNRYSCFLYSDDDDNAEEVRPPPQEKKKKAAAKDTGSKPNNRGSRNDRPATTSANAKGKDKDRGVKFTAEEREERNNRRNLEDSSRYGETRSSDLDYGYGSRGGSRGGSGRGGGGFRGDGRGRGGPRGGRGGGGFRNRECDRQSGSERSGVKPAEKREGAGSKNWGTYNDDLEETNDANAGNQAGEDESNEDKTWDIEHAEDRETGEGDEKEDQTDVPSGPTEEEPKLMTLDEWKALQQPHQKPVFNLRKPGEGEDPAQWQKMKLIKKEKECEEEDEVEDEDYDYPQRAGRQKQVLEIDFHFTDSRRGGGGGNERRGRGGRGGRSSRDTSRRNGRSRRGGGGGGGWGSEDGPGWGGRDDRLRQATPPRVDDVNDFPSLMG